MFRKGRLFVPVCGCLFTILMALLYLYEPVFLRFIDNKFYDTLLKSSRSGKTSEVPVIVDLDDKSLARFGQWPWPRYRIAHLLSRLRELGASSIALDMVFPTPTGLRLVRSKTTFFGIYTSI